MEPHDDSRTSANPGYALGRLTHALRTLREHADPAVRKRAAAKVTRWASVLEGMAAGKLDIGSRTPIAGTPAWVTPEVVHGGFATGRRLAEGPPSLLEQRLLDGLPAQVAGRTQRERINRWYLSDAGLEALCGALREGTYRIDVPEAGALPVVAWLLEQGHEEAALELLETLGPLLHRLRFTPQMDGSARVVGDDGVHLATVREVTERLRTMRTPEQVRAMNETLRVWNPLFDEMVALWCEAVEGELPRLEDGVVSGGWPCRRWPADWSARRAGWLAAFERARAEHGEGGRHAHPRSNSSRLRAALERCPDGSAALDGREVGWIRRALANTIERHGAPGTERRAALRAVQAVVAARPTHAALAAVVAGRLSEHPSDGGIPALEPLAVEVAEGESAEAPAGQPIPEHVMARVARALEAPVEELVDRGIIGSGEVLAAVLPQLTSVVQAAGIADPVLSDLCARIYAAFRRRRSLLLLHLEHQVRFEELPWIAALAPFRRDDGAARAAAREVLERAALLALRAFPQTVLPNPLVRELGALAERAGLALPLVEEVAADIFIGTFSLKWHEAARVASRKLAGTLYACYYDLPEQWDPPRKARTRWGKTTAEEFAALCRARAAEAGTGRGRSVAENGAVLEQSQILTSHNLAVLADALELDGRLDAPELARRALSAAARWLRRATGRSGCGGSRTPRTPGARRSTSSACVRRRNSSRSPTPGRRAGSSPRRSPGCAA